MGARTDPRDARRSRSRRPSLRPDPRRGERPGTFIVFEGVEGSLDIADELLEWQTNKLLGLETHREGIAVHVRPELVVEIAHNGLQDSTRYPAGLALRFARVVRYREDKKPEEADTIETVRRLHAGGLGRSA